VCYVEGMGDAVVTDVLHRALGASPQRAAIAVALLFGSRARGDHRADSDVDVAVLGDVDRLALSAELSRATGHEVDVVDLADPGYPLLSAVIAACDPSATSPRATIASSRYTARLPPAAGDTRTSTATTGALPATTPSCSPPSVVMRPLGSSRASIHAWSLVA
jgi:predicted nucleotidyltransferase